MNKRSIVYAVAAAACASLLVASAVLARTQHASAGYPSSVGAVSCWDNSGAFMTNICSSPQGWVLPIPNKLTTSGTVTVTLTGQLLAGGSATCALNAFTAAGAQAPGFPVTFPQFSSSVGPVSLTLNSVSPSWFLLVGCSASGGAKVRLLGFEQTP
jgi:hypothetical protein